MKFSLLITFSLSLILGHSQNTDSLLSTPYFTSGVSVLDISGFNFNPVYYNSGSTWLVDSFPEIVVYDSELNYNNSLDSTQSYQVRIGKGGQLYSFRSSFGESVPPQFRPTAWTQPSYGGGTSHAPWMDEVWQMVCVDGAKNNPPDSSYFIHQAGVYLKTPSQATPFFSPLVASYYNPQKMSYSVVNWGQQAHTDDLQNVNHKSSLLYYTTYTNKGKGVIQVDNMIYNFGNDNISFLNMPWGGVRNSSLDHFFISSPTHSYNNSPGQYGITSVVQTANTGGWVAWSNDSLGNSPAMGMVHPVTTNTNGNVFRYGDAGNLSSAWNLRDYNVFEMIRFPSPGQLGFGKSMSFRYYYVLGANVDSVKNTILSNNLVSHSLDTAYTANSNSVDSVYYDFQQSGSSITATISASNSGLLLKTSPFLNSFPLFKITSAANTEVLSSDPYYFSAFAYDGTTSSIELLGFLDKQTAISIQKDTVCAGENYILPDGSILSNLNSDTSFYTVVPSSRLDWDSLILTNLKIPFVNLGVSKTGVTLTSNALAISYQWLDCNNSFSLISGANTSIFTATTNGSYAVEVKQNNCTDTSECILINSVGIIQNDFGNGLLVYPNPTQGEFSLDLGSVNSIIFVTVTDINGKLIQSNTYNKSQVVNQKLEAPAGIYILQIESNDKKAVIRLVKK